MRGVLKPNLKTKLLGVSLLSLAMACSKSSSNGPSLNDLANSKVKQGTDDASLGEMRVVSRAKLEEMIRNGEVVRARPDDGQGNSSQLVIGFPKAALGQEHFFGGVIIATDDKDNETLGGLKLTDLPPFHVVPQLVTDPQSHQQVLLLVGCSDKCKPNVAGKENIMGFPVSGTDATHVFVDFSTIGNDLNLVQMMDPNGDFTHYVGTSASTVQVSYSNDTLEFDVLGLMKAAPAPAAVRGLLAPQNPNEVAAAPDAQQVTFTTRWYLKKRFPNAKFKQQVATAGVGYFMTERFVTPHVEKHELVDNSGKAIQSHYFIKNVPEEYKAPFKQALDDWNTVFQAKTGQDIVSYEFIDGNDPLAADVIPGDVRIHVIEWDLENKASYGGLGPSIADQATGAMITSNILIQGPTIVQIYTEWFQVNKEAQALRDMGEEARADDLLKNSRNRLFQEMQSKESGPKLALSLAGKYKFNVNSQDPRLQDAAAKKLDFEIVPANVTYEDYMFGYFREMVGHELGHNMGLRHNFKGNLFATDGLEVGHQSGSIMEYLSRPYRWKDQISAYDLMAIDYGYNFKAPARKDMYCTDEDKFDITKHTGSAECSADDAENDPFTQQLARLVRARDLYIGNGTADAPVWGKTDIAPQVDLYSNGTLIYADAAQRSMSTWLRFFAAPNRPAKNVAAVQAYVVNAVKNVACEDGLEAALTAAKPAAAAQQSIANLNDFRKSLQDKITATLGANFANAISCLPANRADLADEL